MDEHGELSEWDIQQGIVYTEGAKEDRRQALERAAYEVERLLEKGYIGDMWGADVDQVIAEALSLWIEDHRKNEAFFTDDTRSQKGHKNEYLPPDHQRGTGKC